MNIGTPCGRLVPYSLTARAWSTVLAEASSHNTASPAPAGANSRSSAALASDLVSVGRSDGSFARLPLLAKGLDFSHTNELNWEAIRKEVTRDFGLWLQTNAWKGVDRHDQLIAMTDRHACRDAVRSPIHDFVGGTAQEMMFGLGALRAFVDSNPKYAFLEEDLQKAANTFAVCMVNIDKKKDADLDISKLFKQFDTLMEPMGIINTCVGKLVTASGNNGTDLKDFVRQAYLPFFEQIKAQRSDLEISLNPNLKETDRLCELSWSQATSPDAARGINLRSLGCGFGDFVLEQIAALNFVEINSRDANAEPALTNAPDASRARSAPNSPSETIPKLPSVPSSPFPEGRAEGFTPPGDTVDGHLRPYADQTPGPGHALGQRLPVQGVRVINIHCHVYAPANYGSGTMNFSVGAKAENEANAAGPIDLKTFTHVLADGVSEDIPPIHIEVNHARPEPQQASPVSLSAKTEFKPRGVSVATQTDDSEDIANDDDMPAIEVLSSPSRPVLTFDRRRLPDDLFASDDDMSQHSYDSLRQVPSRQDSVRSSAKSEARSEDTAMRAMRRFFDDGFASDTAKRRGAQDARHQPLSTQDSMFGPTQLARLPGATNEPARNRKSERNNSLSDHERFSLDGPDASLQNHDLRRSPSSLSSENSLRDLIARNEARQKARLEARRGAELIEAEIASQSVKSVQGPLPMGGDGWRTQGPKMETPSLESLEASQRNSFHEELRSLEEVLKKGLLASKPSSTKPLERFMLPENFLRGQLELVLKQGRQDLYSEANSLPYGMINQHASILGALDRDEQGKPALDSEEGRQLLSALATLAQDRELELVGRRIFGNVAGNLRTAYKPVYDAIAPWRPLRESLTGDGQVVASMGSARAIGSGMHFPPRDSAPMVAAH